ncbi:hypothetical protein [Elizabethkingia anophelis]|uniref:hypothetical protein n=1 Tax=Elizabethkingia anophelis TaxID=1117645 RepID=UPI0009992F98|nr:hypothetical protein [Elizabethkingia anophelis]MCT3905647.1 hypothetical protein [Elizabethkingia anophelis]MCT4013381.1 hypothetical protein [Elizabethkingia anophelis]MDV3899123.1 hypothetical protein [Elizabethkingia anophelis]OPC55812.1 hypothetical protein BAY06_17495 [Elizabethkingia anophelis]CAH1144754.1 hypothetical protein EAVVTKC53_01681 [Elizabethkingia anophelis]
MKTFVIMPFSKEFDDIYQLGIKETAKNEKVIAYRLDEELFDEGMLDKIYKEIENSDFIIADLSNKNANVFYELGYAHAIGKLTILLTQNSEDIPFDLKHKRHIIYGNSIKHLKEQLKKNIIWAKNEIEQNKNIPIEIELKTNGILNASEEYAEAELNFKIDIENVSDKISTEVQGIYLHSTKEWNIAQEGKKLPNKKSDIKPFSYKYQLNIENPKLPKKGWTQLNLNLKRLLAYAYDGDIIRDSYTIKGELLLEIATDKGTYTKKLPLNLFIDNLPF